MLITNLNEEQSLLTRLGHLIAESEEMRVLVVFSIFFGISALHGGLRSERRAIRTMPSSITFP